MNVAYIRKTVLLAAWLLSPPHSAQRQVRYPRKAKQGVLFVSPVWGRDISMHCLMWLYQQPFAVQTRAVSLVPLALHLVTSVGYFCHICMLQYDTKLLRTLFSEFCSAAAMPFWHTLREYRTCPKQRLILATSSLTDQRSAGHNYHFLPHLAKSWWHILVGMSGFSSATLSNFFSSWTEYCLFSPTFSDLSLIACLLDPSCIILIDSLLSYNGKSLTWWIKMLGLLCIWNKFSRKGKNLQFLSIQLRVRKVKICKEKE